MKRRSEVEDASSRKSKRRPLANRRAEFFIIQKSRFFSRRPNTFLKSRNSLSKVGRDSGITRRATCLDVSSLVTFGLERCENHEPNPDLNPGFQKIIIPVCRLSQSASRKSRTLCQKARNGNCSSITGCRQIVQE